MDVHITTWQSLFFNFLVGGVVLLAIFRLLRYFLPVFLKDNKKVRQIVIVIPVFETAMWLLFFSWYIFRFAEVKSLFAVVVLGILLALIFWINRFIIKDLLAGMIFRTTGRFREGDIIIHREKKGTIKKFRFDSLEVETPDGQILYIPYSTLQENMTIKSESNEQTAAYSFLLECARKKSQAETINDIRNFLVSLPWSSVQKIPLIVIKEQTETLYLIDITVYPVEKPFAKKIENLTVETFKA